MIKPILVTKRNGDREPLDIDKLHRVVMFACDGISGVSASEIEMHSQIQFYSGISSASIQETLIKSAADLISEESPNYQYVAGRLINYALRKQVYNSFTPPPLLNIIKKNVSLGMYDAQILDEYSEEEINELDEYIKHERDEKLTYVAMEQFRGKYLIKNRVTGEVFETPQIVYMMIAATLFGRYPPSTRMQYVKDYYDAISTHDISLPTPVMGGVRTPQRQFSSCVLIETDDSLDSITATATAIVKYVSQKAGIGIGAGKIRALGSPVRNGDTSHTGVIPYYKLFQSAVKSCSQGGIRNGCVSADSFVEICRGVEIDGKEYSISDVILVNNKEIRIFDLVNILTNMAPEEIENASMQDLLERSATISQASNDDS
jgi:ribonucleoside-diphosphate reductase alpha chain